MSLARTSGVPGASGRMMPTGRQLLARRGATQPQGPINYSGSGYPGQQGAGYPGSGGGPQRPVTPSATSGTPQQMIRPFSAGADTWAQMQAAQMQPQRQMLPGAGAPTGTRPRTGAGAAAAGAQQGGAAGQGAVMPTDRGARAASGRLGGSTGFGGASVGGAQQGGIAGQGAVMAGAPQLPAAIQNALATRQVRTGAPGSVLGAQTSGLHEGGAGTQQAVPNPLGAQAASPGEDANKLQGLWNLLTGNPSDTSGGAAGGNEGATGTGGKPLNTLDMVDKLIAGAGEAAGNREASDWQDEAYKAGVDAMTLPAAAAGGASSALNAVSQGDINQYYDNFSDLGKLTDAGSQLMDPAYWAQSEAANQQLLNNAVTGNRDEQLIQALGMAGRGGQLGSGTLQGIYGSADKAMQEGQLKLAADAAQRRLAGTQAGAGIYGNATGQKYGLLQEGYTSPRETFAALAEMFPEVLDALNPMPFT